MPTKPPPPAIHSRTGPITAGSAHSRPPLQAVSPMPALTITSTSAGHAALADLVEAEETHLHRQAREALEHVGAGDHRDVRALDQEFLVRVGVVDPRPQPAPAVEHRHLHRHPLRQLARRCARARSRNSSHSPATCSTKSGNCAARLR